MDFHPREIIRNHLQNLPSYESIEPYEVLSAKLGFKPEHITKLDANENLYGPSPAVKEVLKKLPYPHIYPDPESRNLRKSLGSFLNIDPDQIMVGSGADELIDLIARITLNPGDSVLICPPTFGMYEFDARVHGGDTIEVPRKPDFSMDFDSIKRKVMVDKPKLIFLASPNNPDGSLLNRVELEDLLELPVLVVLDEAYIEFSGLGRLGNGASHLAALAEHENLIILRTFSKWAGLAGLRVGYGIFPRWLMGTLWKAKQPYNVNVAASSAAIASLQDLLFLEENIDRIITERARLMKSLTDFKQLKAFPSFGNFILCQVLDFNASQVKHTLAEEFGILVRYFNKPGLHNMIRITVGKPEQSDKLIIALQKILE